MAESLPMRISTASRRPPSLGTTVAGAVSLAMGEPDGGTPAHVVDAAVAALRAGRTRYSAITGSPQLRDALGHQLAATTGLSLSGQNIVVTHGGSAGLASTVLALVRPGDRVLIPEPTYSLYADHLAMAGATAVWVANGHDGNLDLARLSAEAPGARMIILCNPLNPTGGVFAKRDLAGLGTILRANPDLLLLSDEAYSDIIFDDIEFTSALTLTDVVDRVVLAGTFSKSYAMTGWRLGYVCAAREVAASINLVHRTINGPVNTFVQDAGSAALDTPEKDLREQARSYQRRRDMVMACLDELPDVTVATPRGAFYAFPRIDRGLNSSELTQRCAEGGLLVRAGSEFGPSGEGHVRLSFATDEATLEQGLLRFTEVITKL